MRNNKACGKLPGVSSRTVAEDVDRRLTEALMLTFPASDPIALRITPAEAQPVGTSGSDSRQRR
jgi:hypothetical protein